MIETKFKELKWKLKFQEYDETNADIVRCNGKGKSKMTAIYWKFILKNV